MTTRKTSARDERLAAKDRVAEMRRRERAGQRRRGLVIWGATAAVVLAIVATVAVVVVREQANKPSLAAVKTYQVKGGHVSTPVTYEQSPPVGGPHNPVWLNCGIYDHPVPNENAVHSLEHGAVWVTYRPDLAKADVAKLTRTLDQTYLVLSPYPGLDAPVVASAWGKQLKLTGADDPRLEAFVRAYRLGPQTPEPGAACTGGTDGTTAAPSGTGATVPAPQAS